MVCYPNACATSVSHIPYPIQSDSLLQQREPKPRNVFGPSFLRFRYHWDGFRGCGDDDGLAFTYQPSPSPPTSIITYKHGVGFNLCVWVCWMRLEERKESPLLRRVSVIQMMMMMTNTPPSTIYSFELLSLF